MNSHAEVQFPRPWPNLPLHLTAARWRFGMNPKGHGWAVAGERQR